VYGEEYSSGGEDGALRKDSGNNFFIIIIRVDLSLGKWFVYKQCRIKRAFLVPALPRHFTIFVNGF